MMNFDRERFRGQKVGVVLGGDSSEREISLRTGTAFFEALKRLDYDVTAYDVPADLAKLEKDTPSAVILGLHGGNGENGVFQGWLSIAGIPYTGSGVMASAIAMDKMRTKSILRDHHVPVAAGIWIAYDRIHIEEVGAYLDAVPLPNVVKLNNAGSSVGVYLCEDHDSFVAAIHACHALAKSDPSSGILIEEKILGPEYSVGIFDGEYMGAIRIQPAAKFYDFTAKYNSNSTQYLDVEDTELIARLSTIGAQTYRAVGCQGVARVDVMGEPDALRVLEINTIPGMTATSLIPKMAVRLGFDFDSFTEILLSSAHL
jgi:D-alanine-D-alanine ligase